MLFLTCSWKFLRLDKLKQLKFKLEKKIGIEKHAGKVRRGCSKTGKGVLKQERCSKMQNHRKK